MWYWSWLNEHWLFIKDIDTDITLHINKRDQSIIIMKDGQILQKPVQNPKLQHINNAKRRIYHTWKIKRILPIFSTKILTDCISNIYIFL